MTYSYSKLRNYTGRAKAKRQGGIAKYQTDRRTASRNTRFATKRASYKQIEQLRKNAGEKKGCDVLLTSANVTSTTTTNANSIVLNLVETGNGSWNRVGKQIYLKSVRLVGNAQTTLSLTSVTGLDSMVMFRMVVVWDKQPSGGTVPVWNDIFGYTLQDGTEASTVLCPPKYDTMGRYKVLRDCRMVVPNPVPPPSGLTIDDVLIDVPFDEYIKLGNKITIYSGQSTPMTIADVNTGGLYVYFRVTTPQGSNSWSVTADSVARLRYSD